MCVILAPSLGSKISLILFILNISIIFNIHVSVNCQWSPWSKQGLCSKSCGGGSQQFTRSKTVSEKNGGSCSGSSQKFEPCNTQSCPSKFMNHILTYGSISLYFVTVFGVFLIFSKFKYRMLSIFVS